MTTAHINRIATAVPPHDVHDIFVHFARTLLDEPRARPVFDRMAAKAQIAHRFSVLSQAAAPEGVSDDVSRVYSRGRFPTTAQRMQLFEKHAPTLAVATVAKLALGAEARRITHVIVTSCTGMYAPGLDLDLVEQCGLDPSVER
ncbi:MAG TPA: type III polyketide synthase, partial [Polyangiaceae bacterium]